MKTFYFLNITFNLENRKAKRIRTMNIMGIRVEQKTYSTHYGHNIRDEFLCYTTGGSTLPSFKFILRFGHQLNWLSYSPEISYSQRTHKPLNEKIKKGKANISTLFFHGSSQEI